jgi:DNA-binding CsgD family transcriptional regulator
MASIGMDHLSKHELLYVLEFILASQKFTERDSLYDSLKHLGRTVLHCDQLVIGTCSSFNHTVMPDRTRCSNFDSLVTLETELQDQQVKSRQSTDMSQVCSNGCSSKNPDERIITDSASVTVACNQKFVNAPSLCVASIGSTHADHSTVTVSNYEILQNLAPYVTDAFSRLAAVAANSPCANSTTHPKGEMFLTPRERQILEWSSKGKGCWETGSILGISERTVKFHLQNIYRKLNVVNRAQAITKAMQQALL